MQRRAFAALAAWFAGAAATSSLADLISHSGSVSFSSDAEPNQTVTLPSFDTQGGTLTLTGVTVDVSHSGSADAAGDNDDPFKTTTVRARIIRTLTASGPGVGAFGTKTITSADQFLEVDDGDLTNFDPSPPDGIAFGVLSYADESAGSFSPATGLYATPGPGTVDFEVSPVLMVNDQQFIGPAPDAWQLEVENPDLTVKVKVTYEYTPEPASLSLMALAALALGPRRRS